MGGGVGCNGRVGGGRCDVAAPPKGKSRGQAGFRVSGWVLTDVLSSPEVLVGISHCCGWGQPGSGGRVRMRPLKQSNELQGYIVAAGTERGIRLNRTQSCLIMLKVGGDIKIFANEEG